MARSLMTAVKVLAVLENENMRAPVKPMKWLFAGSHGRASLVGLTGQGLTMMGHLLTIKRLKFGDHCNHAGS